ncbi:MAG: putative transcriptional regulator protein [Crocinitomicaceae bacterium]|jgi:predicted DNA-binding transcriptional regulator YafY|nr:putative transcriptional regulator protein [Crocinitomicaceae bacterium]
MPHIKNALIRFRVIDRCIRNTYKPYPSKEELRKACEEALFGSDDGANICDSTIEKDIFAMRMEHDAPIKYSKRHHGYYYEDPDFTINDIPLTENDLEAIKFAANTLMQFKDVEMFRQFGFAIDKIFDRVNISSDPREKDIAHLVQFETATSANGNEFLAPLLDGIRTKKIMQFDYESYQSGKRKPRRVVPLLLKEYRNRWYLISYDCIKESVITYALERMENLEDTSEFFNQRIDFDAQKFFKNAIGITANDSAPEKILFKADNIAAKYIISQPFHQSQQVIKEGKNKTTFSIEVIVSEELIRSFLSFGGEIEIVEPESLRSTMIKRIAAMRESYDI